MKSFSLRPRILIGMLAATLLVPAAASAQSRREEREQERREGAISRQQQELAMMREEFGELANQRRLQAIEQAKEILATQDLDPNSEAQLRMRLANFYVEQAQYEAFKEIEAFNEEYDQWFDTPEEEQGPEPTLDTTRSLAYRAQAVQHFETVLQNFPNFDRADEALYALAFSLAEMDEKAAARDRYEELVRRFEDSGYVPDAYTNLGEYYFEEGNAFKALQNYRKATEYPEARIYTFALYKLGWCYYNVGEYDQAIDTMKSVVSTTQELLQTDPERVGINLEEEALKDLVQFFAEASDEDGDLEEAEQYFKNLGRPDYYRLCLRRLAANYFETGRNELAILTYRKLIADDPMASDNPEHLDEIIKAFWSRDNWDEAQVEIDSLIADYGRDSSWHSHNSSDEEALAEANRIIEKNLARTATESHQLALQRRSQRLLQLAEAQYQRYVDYFPSGENSYEMRYWYAEVLYKLQKYPESIEHYAVVRDADPEGKYLRDSALGVVFAVEEILKPERRRREREWAGIRRERERSGATPEAQFAPIERTEWENALIQACDRYVELLPDDDQTLQLRHRAAYMLFETNDFNQANPRFLALVEASPRSELAEDAIEIVLNTYEKIENWTGLNEAARSFYANEEIGSSDRFRSRLKNLYLGASLKIAESIAASGDDAGAGASYLAFFEEFENDEAAEEDKLQLALYNSQFHFFQAGNREQAITLRHRFLDTYPEVPEEGAERQLYEKNAALLGSHYESIADFPRAVEFYSKLIERNPEFASDGFQSAQNALYNVGVFLEAMGDWEAANARFASFIETYPEHEAAHSLRIRMAQNHFDNDDVDGARTAWQALYNDDTLPFDLAFEARAAEARSYWDGDDKDEARRMMRDALRDFDRAAGTAEDPAALGAAPVFAAEMRFKMLEEQFEEFEGIQLTADRNAGRNLRRKSEALGEMVTAYTEVIASGAGKWAIAALVGIGRAYDHFATSLIESPCPPSLSEEQCEIYQFTLRDRAYEPQSKAAEAYTQAMDKSFELGLYTEFSFEAARQLEQLRPEEFPPMRELIPEPDYQANPFRFTTEFAN